LEYHDKKMTYGTGAVDPRPEWIECGPLAVEIAGGIVVGVYWNGVEVLRGIAYPVRDRNWFTHGDRTIETGVKKQDGMAVYRRRFETAEGAILGSFTCELHARGHLRAHVAFRAEHDVAVNRAGFVVLHPIAEEAGAALSVAHSDGTKSQTQLPRLISPGQPVKAIRALSYAVPAARIDIAFEGDVFEMEDQRNWTDASFKTYCRPLALPFPYDIPGGTAWEQTITVDLSGRGDDRSKSASAGTISLGPSSKALLPRVVLAQEEEWGRPANPLSETTATVLRTDLRLRDASARVADIAANSPGLIELEAVLPDDAGSARAALLGLREALAAARARLASLTVLPAAYLVSHQPEGPWPTGLNPVEARILAVQQFADLPIGTGVFSNFTELNRLPQRDPKAAFVTYGTTAIVHAADDRSVMQTLEALPQVHASAAALYPGVPIRLGLVSIGMRSNPYGSACAPNPENVRKPGAMFDPRQEGLFGAAFMVGALAATADLPVERIVVGGMSGPFALLNADGSARPAWHVFSALAKFSSARRCVLDAPPDFAGVAVTEPDGSRHLILANKASGSREVSIPLGARIYVLDDRSILNREDPAARLPLAPMAAELVTMGPYAVMFAKWHAEA
jgi:hypothetical protein